MKDLFIGDKMVAYVDLFRLNDVSGEMFYQIATIFSDLNPSKLEDYFIKYLRDTRTTLYRMNKDVPTEIRKLKLTVEQHQYSTGSTSVNYFERSDFAFLAHCYEVESDEDFSYNPEDPYETPYYVEDFNESYYKEEIKRTEKIIRKNVREIVHFVNRRVRQVGWDDKEVKEAMKMFVLV